MEINKCINVQVLGGLRVEPPVSAGRRGREQKGRHAPRQQRVLELRVRRYSMYLLYWYNSASTDAAGGAEDFADAARWDGAKFLPPKVRCSVYDSVSYSVYLLYY
jgi:hypothetical protein